MNGDSSCTCRAHPSPCPRVAITGGPGAGKTAVLEVVRRELCAHVAVLPEAASLLFRGGFPRGHEAVERRAAQRAIYYVQRELGLARRAKLGEERLGRAGPIGHAVDGAAVT